MKITSFNPQITSSSGKDITALFEALGFETKHAPAATTETGEIQSYRMKDGNGFYVDVTDSASTKQDETAIRMNVDNFEEAYELLRSHGFTNTRGDGTFDLKSSTTASMIAPSGFKIILIHHIQ